MAQFVKCPILGFGSGHDLRVKRSSPSLGSMLRDSHPLPLPPLARTRVPGAHTRPVTRLRSHVHTTHVRSHTYTCTCATPTRCPFCVLHPLLTPPGSSPGLLLPAPIIQEGAAHPLGQAPSTTNSHTAAWRAESWGSKDGISTPCWKSRVGKGLV